MGVLHRQLNETGTTQSFWDIGNTVDASSANQIYDCFDLFDQKVWSSISGIAMIHDLDIMVSGANDCISAGGVWVIIDTQLQNIRELAAKNIYHSILENMNQL